MMPHTIDQLALLPEEKAVQTVFDDRNDRLFRWLLVGACLTGFSATMALSHEGEVLSAWLAVATLIVASVMFFVRRMDFYEQNLRPWIVGWYVAEYAALLFTFRSWGPALAISAFVFPFGLLLLRLRPTQYLSLGATFATSGIWAGLMLRNRLTVLDVVFQVLMVAGFNAAFVTVAIRIARRARNLFVRDWHRISSRERERIRMREELLDARKIQLAMLPQSAPSLDWLELSSVSLPATEVGGDFFDYYLLDDGRAVIVIGDVAGHGVASGLMLAGVKSGLSILRDELCTPLTVLAKLNRMVRDWARWRLLVTLQIAVIDPSSGATQVVAAGHPPLLHAHDGGIVEIGRGSLPLGTRLEPRYEEIAIRLDEGDVLLFFTDGISELLDRHGEPYGDSRLAKTLREVSHQESSRAIRDSLLADFASFKGDEPQRDDITLLVARFGSNHDD